MTSQSENVDARFSTFNDIRGNQYDIDASQYNVQASFQYNIGPIVSTERERDVAELRAFLQPVDRVGFYPPTCLEGTRLDILDTIDRWVDSRDGHNILLITGSPGVGKSSIASTMDARLRLRQRLGASFYFQQENVNLSNPCSVWRTIAFDLSRFDNILMDALFKVMKEYTVEPTRPDINLHFEHLVEGILVDNHTHLSARPPVVVLDALNESAESHWHRIFLATLSKWARLPPEYKLLITSRSERLPASLLRCCTQIELPSGHGVSPEAHQDIRLFLSTGFKYIKEDNDFLNDSWPEEQMIHSLTQRAAGLFIWAKTALDFVKSGPVTELLEALLAGESVGGSIDDLYKKILEKSFSAVRPQELELARSILSVILLVKIPIQLHELQNFLKEDVSQASVHFVLKQLSSVISSGTSGAPLRVCHLSFAEFLFDSQRCGATFAIDKALQSKELVDTCIRVMQNGLHFNICNIESSYIRNKNVPNEQIDRFIPKPLSYACIFWAGHLKDAAALERIDQSVSSKVFNFFQNQLLYWLEVMSLLKQIPSATAALLRIADVYRETIPDIEALAIDARNFISMFWAPISDSAPHIYLSALPFSPQHSSTYRNFIESCPQTISFVHGASSQWPITGNIIGGHVDWVTSVAYSPDGRYIVSGSEDNSIRIWDVNTGDMIAGPLEGHTDYVRSVAYSPSGRYVASGSNDMTLRIWDVALGIMVTGPLEGHSGSVTAVAYSPDGTYVASSSDDGTIRVWNVNTGQMSSGPFQGHSTTVTSVAYSPDGRYIVSGSNDMTVRIWDVRHEVLSRQFESFCLAVTCIAYSPDGRQIAAGSDDYRVRIWDVNTNKMVSGPWSGHTDCVTSVAYSPDGRCVASSSNDRTIRIWDVSTGNVIHGPYKGHTRGIMSIAYSPHGRHVATGAQDRTVRTWDVELVEVNSGPYEGHSDKVTSVTYSPDGKYVASSSDDCTVRIWDTITGRMAFSPFNGHIGRVTCVSYSRLKHHIASGSDDQTVLIWDTKSMDVIAGPLHGHNGWVSSVAYSPNGKHVASGSDDNMLRVWDINTGNLAFSPFSGHNNNVTSVAYSSDGNYIVSGSDDGTLRVWDVNNREIRLVIHHPDEVKSVACSPNGRHVTSGSSDRKVRIWNLTTGRPVCGPCTGHIQGVTSVAYSPDGSYIVSGSDDCTVRIWDAGTGKSVYGPLKGHTSSLKSVTYSPDGRYIASGSGDNTVRIWHVNLGGISLQDADAQSNSMTTNDPLLHGFTPDFSNWCYSDGSVQLFWVSPQLHGLCSSETAMILGSPLRKLDFKYFVHGSSWTQCRIAPSQS